MQTPDSEIVLQAIWIPGKLPAGAGEPVPNPGKPAKEESVKIRHPCNLILPLAPKE